MVHRWKETGEVPKTKLGRTLIKKIEGSGASRASLWPEGLHEVPVAYNAITGETRALVVPVSTEKKDAWKAAQGSEWIVGTADFVSELLDLPWVDDLKTGRRVEYLDHRYQQSFYTLAWTLWTQRTLTPARSTITHWPKYPLGGKPGRFGVVIEPETMEEFQTKLRTLYEDYKRLKELGTESVVARLSDGPQCIFCPSKPSCTKGQKYE